MGKTFEIEIGGKTRVLRFQLDDALTLQRRFKRSRTELVFRDVLGLEPDAAGVFKGNVYLFDIEVQIALLTLALRRGGSKVTEDQVTTWLDEHGQAGGEQADLIVPAAKCALYSSAITGKILDLDKKEDEPEAGKETAPRETS